MGGFILIAGSITALYGGILATRREYSKSLYLGMGALVLFFAYGVEGGSVYKWIFAGIVIAFQTVTLVRLKLMMNGVQIRDADL